MFVCVNFYEISVESFLFEKNRKGSWSEDIYCIYLEGKRNFRIIVFKDDVILGYVKIRVLIF